MKILITTDWYEPVINGVVTSVINLKNGLTTRGHEVRILTLSHTIHSYTENEVTYIGSFSADKIYPQARIKIKTTRLQCVKDLIAWQPDIVHSQCELSTFRLGKKIARKLKIPFIHTYHTVYENYTHYFLPSIWLGKKLVSCFTRRILQETDCVVVPSEKVRFILESYNVHTPIYTIPTGIQLKSFSENPHEEWIRLKKKEYGIPEENLVLLYVGRLAKEKSIEELLSFIPYFSKKDISLLIIGNGPYYDKLKQESVRLGIASQVIFTGMISTDQIKKYYHLGDIFVNASTSETQGLTYFEALASGLPMLCREDKCLDGIIENGVNGWKYKDREEFVRYILMFQENPVLRDLMSICSLEKAEEFSTEIFSGRVEALYSQVIKEQ